MPEPVRTPRRPGRHNGAASYSESSDWTPARFEPMYQGCSFLQHCYKLQDQVDEPQWLAMLGLVGRSASDDLDSNALAHDFSKDHPGYHPLKTDEKLEHAVRDLGPRTCVEIEDKFDVDGKFCGRCRHRGRIKSPIVLGRRGQQRGAAPPPEPPPDLAAKWMGPAVPGAGNSSGSGSGGRPE